MTYAKNQKSYMENYLLDGRCALSNNAAENANGLNVYTYLQYLLIYMPDTDWHNHPEELDDLMTWSEAVQAEYKQP